MGICFGQDEFGKIPNKYKTLEEVTAALKVAGLEASDLIIGIDYTASNEEQGEKTFGGRCLHHLEVDLENPYQKVIRIIGRTLEEFDEDNIIPTYGFGDILSKDSSVFHLTPEPQTNRHCVGFEEVLKVYNDITPNIRLSGPTSYVPMINKAIEWCMSRETSSYHILVIIADGQVCNEKDTIKAIEKASNYPLSILVVGVGDGPWDQMVNFDDKIKNRKFDNFQFANYHELISKARKKGLNEDPVFANMALMEIPDQFKCIKKLGLLGRRLKDGKYADTV